MLGEYRAGGNAQSVTTLGGVVITHSRGFKSRTTLFTLAAGEAVQALDPNPRRMWAIITNNTLDWCRYMFAATGAWAAGGHRMDIGGHLLINELLPWIGAVVVFSPAGSGGCTITVTEVTADE